MNIWYRVQVTRNQHGLFALAFQMLKNRLEAEDVVQDTFVKMWEQKQAGGAVEKSWLYKVARNQCLDILRRRKYAQEYEMAQAVGSDIGIGPAEEALNETLSDEVAEALNQLAEPYKSLLVLREISGLNYKALAQTLDLSLSQTKVYLHRARAQLKERLEQTYAETQA